MQAIGVVRRIEECVIFGQYAERLNETQYTREDSINYYLELIYWACAYNVKVYPEKCSKDILQFNWFKREKNKIEIVRENRSTSVFVEDLETHIRTEIDGWSMKY